MQPLLQMLPSIYGEEREISYRAFLFYHYRAPLTSEKDMILLIFAVLLSKRMVDSGF